MCYYRWRGDCEEISRLNIQKIKLAQCVVVCTEGIGADRCHHIVGESSRCAFYDFGMPRPQPFVSHSWNVHIFSSFFFFCIRAAIERRDATTTSQTRDKWRLFHSIYPHSWSCLGLSCLLHLARHRCRRPIRLSFFLRLFLARSLAALLSALFLQLACNSVVLCSVLLAENGKEWFDLNEKWNKIKTFYLCGQRAERKYGEHGWKANRTWVERLHYSCSRTTP